MSTEEETVISKGLIAKEKLLSGISTAIQKGDYQKVFGEDLKFSRSFCQKLANSFSREEFKEKMNLIVSLRGEILVGFYQLGTAENFLNETEIKDLFRWGILETHKHRGVILEEALKKAIKKYPF